MAFLERLRGGLWEHQIKWVDSIYVLLPGHNISGGGQKWSIWQLGRVAICNNTTTSAVFCQKKERVNLVALFVVAGSLSNLFFMLEPNSDQWQSTLTSLICYCFCCQNWQWHYQSRLFFWTGASISGTFMHFLAITENPIIIAGMIDNSEPRYLQ